MIVSLIKDILIEHRNCISEEELQKILKTYSHNSFDIVRHSTFFSFQNGVIFLKSTLIEQKEIFFQEFEDYIKNKVQTADFKKSIIDNLKYYIPDSLFVEYLNINLENKLFIFDLLFNIIVKPKRAKDRFFSYFNTLLEFYELIVIYSSLLVENINIDNERFFKIIENIEAQEAILKNHLFNILTSPDSVKLKLEYWEKEFKQTEDKLNLIIEKSFSLVKFYSERLLKRIIDKEVKNFNNASLLSRFEYQNFYDWILVLNEQNNTTEKPKHNLFEDLGF
ncbi:MAG: hypothetical protein A2086_11525 [Spirochaetes bacterium GWD1_27_9]|nr:MAG: hypothetical protein A2086_11525 [Spirochaetes bacterium GWD1_27_9]